MLRICNFSESVQSEMYTRLWQKEIDRCVCYVVTTINLATIRVYFNFDLVLPYRMFPHGDLPIHFYIYLRFRKQLCGTACHREHVTCCLVCVDSTTATKIEGLE